MTTMKLYDFELSGNGYKVRPLLSMLGLDDARERVNSATGETQSDAFRRINPRGQIPVLEHDGSVIWDSMAILV
jgi:glutathione S-transferase